VGGKFLSDRTNTVDDNCMGHLTTSQMAGIVEQVNALV
jgi:hypothetical protein